eukprot:GHVP01017491.1.p1 GENE.GHVP01017491.1~~GHVP01017491.1.p1  ORF type:complete len:103 (-),score=3.29 GHVP01017491.1:191-499(-)
MNIITKTIFFTDPSIFVEGEHFAIRKRHFTAAFFYYSSIGTTTNVRQGELESSRSIWKRCMASGVKNFPWVFSKVFNIHIFYRKMFGGLHLQRATVLSKNCF